MQYSSNPYKYLNEKTLRLLLRLINNDRTFEERGERGRRRGCLLAVGTFDVVARG